METPEWAEAAVVFTSRFLKRSPTSPCVHTFPSQESFQLEALHVECTAQGCANAKKILQSAITVIRSAAVH